MPSPGDVSDCDLARSRRSGSDGTPRDRVGAFPGSYFDKVLVRPMRVVPFRRGTGVFLAIALQACEEPIYYGAAECEVDRTEEVRLSELDEPLVEMSLSPAAYLDTIVGAHPLMVYRDQDSDEVPADAVEVEIVFEPFADEADLDIHGPRTFNGRQRCYFERLHAFTDFSLRTPDGSIVAGPSRTSVPMSAIDEELTEFGAEVVFDADFLATLGLEDVPTTLEVSGVVGGDDSAKPERPLSIRGSVYDASITDNWRRLLVLRSLP